MSRDATGLAGAIAAPPAGTRFLPVAILCAMVAFLDGVDTVSMGPAGPAILQTMHLTPASLGPLVSSSLFGAMIGAFSFGNLGDRFGRKLMLLVATLTFGIFTIATARPVSFGELILVRFIAGIGTGGATPLFIAIATGYTPPEHRARVTSAIWTAFPVGNVVGTLLAAFLLAKFSWRAIFVVGGVLPLLVFLALLIWLPGTARSMRAPAAGVAAPGGMSAAATAPPREEAAIGHARYGALFAGGVGVDTMLLWLAFLSVFGTVAAVFFFAPALMHAQGIPLKTAALILGVGGIGGLIGSPLAGILIEKFGAAAVMSTTLVLGAFGVSAVGYVAGSVPGMVAALAFLGIFVSGMGISGVLAVAAITYPAAIRSTGLGSAVAAGRLGQVITPLLIALLERLQVQPPHLFLFVAPLLLVGAGAIVLLGRRQRQVGSIAMRLAAASVAQPA